MTAAALILLIVPAAIAARQDAEGDDAPPAFESIFDGATLEDWEGDPQLWSVEENAIVGRTTVERPLKANSFLIWKGEPVGDFELRAEVRMIGDNNSGIQYRAKRGEGYATTGYQCDIHPHPPYNGMLYEEGGRGIVAMQCSRIRILEDGTKQPIEDAIEPKEFALNEWHEYVIIARGNRLEHRIGEHVTVIVEDHERGKASREGMIALQLHAGGPYEVRFRKIRLRRL